MSDEQMWTVPGDWVPLFEEVLREQIQQTSDERPLAASDALFDLGVDSFGTVELLIALEDRFGVRLPDQALTAETFATVGSLWSVLAGLLQDGTRAGGGSAAWSPPV
ncbi:phosphopantetheine-binding protein [Kribbella sp. NBC_01505]|uniref:phosphopantetheine-binding protein n=1 Tax=Kribbella sp. NBC_01505 TaxID=2903580 RepID=UPI003866FC5C